MGNNIVCDNYYCQNVSFKPEWFSESSWNIDYRYNENNENKEKPYIIDKGIIKIDNQKSFELLLSKKLLVDFNEIKYISIPINFSYHINKDNEIKIYIIFSNKLLSLNNVNDDFFYINLKLYKNNCVIFRSFNDTIIKKKINSKKINTFSVVLENNLKIILVSEKLYNNKKKNIYENKYLKHCDIDIQNNLFLNFLIKTEKDLEDSEFIHLNFE